MIRLVALEWDGKEARIALARARGKSVVLEQAFVVELPRREATGAVAESDAGAKIASALAQHGISRGDVLVAVGRANIELRFLSTPPVPPEELPDLVRFQALRQFSTLGEDWPLDFVPLGPNSDGGINVLAAAISPELVKQLKLTCTAAGLNVARLVLRPFAAASLLRRQAPDARCRMIVDLLNDEADLTVVIGDQVVFPRTVRLPTTADAESLSRALLGEARRTIIAAQNQLGGRPVEQVVIFGDSKHHAAVKAILERELSIEVQLFDPLASIEVSAEVRDKLPEFPGTFAPLLGMLLDEAASESHAIDFLHPRERPKAPDRRRQYAIAGAAAGALALMIVGWIWLGLWGQSSEIKRLTAERDKLTKLAKQGERSRTHAAKLEEFLAADINWLDKLHTLSERFPPAEKARVDDLYATGLVAGGGRATIQGYADDDSTIFEMEASVRDPEHSIQGSGGKFDAEASTLPWRFKEVITVAAPTERPAVKPTNLPTSKLPASKAPALKAPASKGVRSPAGGGS